MKAPSVLKISLYQLAILLILTTSQNLILWHLLIQLH